MIARGDGAGVLGSVRAPITIVPTRSAADGPVLATKACLSAKPPDRGFIVETVPNQPRNAVAQGAGQAFTFAARLGDILRELVRPGETTRPIAAVPSDRPAITDPALPSSYHI